MNIQPVSGYDPQTLSNIVSRPQPSVAGTADKSNASTDTATISQAARDLLVAQSTSEPGSSQEATTVMDTDQGRMGVDIDGYFTGRNSLINGELPPLLLPTGSNIDALKSQISSAMPGLLAEYNIPSAPDSISYGRNGEMLLPDDYPYASEFKQMLEDNPTMDRELRTVNALASHRAGIRKSMAFQQEYAAAATPAEADAIVPKHSQLFSGQHSGDVITLEFSTDGTLNIKADGELLS